MDYGSIANNETKMKIEVYEIKSENGKSRTAPYNSIYGDSNVFEVQYNPENLSMGFGQKIASKSNAGEKENTQTVTGKEDESISFSLLFDTSLTRSSKGEYQSVKSIYISKLQCLINDENKNIICNVTWGSIISFIGILMTMKVNYTMFSSDGVPLRAKVELTFKQTVIPKEITSNSSSNSNSDSSKRVRLNPGDYLGLLAALEYGSADKWKSIASANNIDNPRLVIPGENIILP